MTKNTTICLNMIVKNEAHVIARCLEAAKPFIDHWVICDTGSTDGTQDLIQEIMADVPGKLLQCPWINFGHNRQEALEAASGMADYLLIIDADEWLEAPENFSFTRLTEPSYFIFKNQPTNRYQVRNIIRNDMGWRWEGIIHETLVHDDTPSFGEIEDAHIEVRQEGARALDPNTYRKDARLLTEALKVEPGNARYQFYLAQSWRDAREYGFAIKHYRKRAAMGGWEEEVYCSLYEIAQAKEARGDEWDECLQAYLAAYEHSPDRAEPLYQIGVYYNQQQNWPMAWLFLNRAADMERPAERILFVQEPIYDWLAKIEAAVSAYYLHRHGDALALNGEALTHPRLPDHLRELVEHNMALSHEVLEQKNTQAA